MDERLITEIVADIVQHHRRYPNHGLDCACMDKYIQEVRLLTESNEPVRSFQNRIDYVIRSAMNR